MSSSFSALADQGLFSAANFGINILLARTMEPSAYGLFASGYALLILGGTVHEALVVEPMVVFGSRRYAPAFAEYFRILWRIHLVFMLALLIISFVAVLVATAAANSDTNGLFLFVLAAPVLLTHWFVRRIAYARARSEVAALSSLIYFAISMVGLLLLTRYSKPSLDSSIVIVASAAVLPILVNLSIVGRRSRGGLLIREVTAAHWEYGRWSLATAAVRWIPGNVYLVLLPIFAGLEATASYKAAVNIISPALVAIGAVSLTMLPALARENQAARRAIIRRILRIGAFSGSGFAIMLLIFGGAVNSVLYAGKFPQAESVVKVIAFVPVITIITAVFSSAVRAAEQPKRMFWPNAVNAVGTLTIGLWVVSRYGALGAGATLLLANLWQALATFNVAKRAGILSG